MKKNKKEEEEEGINNSQHQFEITTIGDIDDDEFKISQKHILHTKSRTE